MVRKLLRENGLKQVDLATELGIREASLTRRLTRKSTWEVDQAVVAAKWFTDKLGREITVEQLFPPSPDTPQTAGETTA